MNHIIATFEARQADPKAIPLMLDLDGNIAESNAHNFFAVVGGKIYTPGSKNVLGGITRRGARGAGGTAGHGGGGGQPDPLRLSERGRGLSDQHEPHHRAHQDHQRRRFPQDVPGPVTLRLLKGWADLVGVDIVAQAIDHMEGEEKEELSAAWNEKQAALGL